MKLVVQKAEEVLDNFWRDLAERAVGQVFGYDVGELVAPVGPRWRVLSPSPLLVCSRMKKEAQSNALSARAVRSVADD